MLRKGGKNMARALLLVVLALFSIPAFGQRDLERRPQLGIGGGAYTLFGDLIVDEGNSPGLKPLSYEVILNALGGVPGPRQYVNAGGRYQFMGLAPGVYELLVVVEHQEVARTRVEILAGPQQERIRQNLNVTLRPSTTVVKSGSVSATEFYKRTDANEKLFVRAKEATDQKRYDDAIATLRQLVTADPHDFLGWAELGTVYLFNQNSDEAEVAYVKSVTEKPRFFLGQMNLGRLRVMRKNFEGAIEPLTAAVDIQPGSADANAYLGEAYLQIKKGSKAVVYLNEAIKLDPIGKADLHLRLATLYNAAGMKDKAAIEYEEFLKKKPEYSQAKKLRDYITANKPKP
jgi:cytochrome c-type biogenesis protein CcmH/NrfG